MKKIISVLLAVVLIASVSVVMAAADGVAKVTVSGLDGKSETKTFNVGDEFTVYSMLDTSSVNGGRVGSITGYQTYDKTVVELSADYYTTPASRKGLIKDAAKETMFPVLKTDAMANALPEELPKELTEDLPENSKYNALYFTATNPYTDESPFVFDSPDAMLVVTNYKVIAAGETEIHTSLDTLATATDKLDRLVVEGKIVNPNFTLHVSFLDEEPAGSSVTGNVLSFHDADAKVTVQLLKDGAVVAETEADCKPAAQSNRFNSAYSFEGIENGDYTLRVSKQYHVTRDYEITVDGDVTQEAQINLLGDITGDGRTNVMDVNAAKNHAKNITLLTDYRLQCADIFGTPNGEINAFDVNRIRNHAKEITLLYPI